MRVIIGRKYKRKGLMKKSSVCGLALLTLASTGLSNSFINHQTVTNTNTNTAKASTSFVKYNHIVNYLHWVQRYNHTHEVNWHSYKLTHLYDYMNGLNKHQFNKIRNIFNRYHLWYYRNDSALDKVNDYLNYGSSRRTALTRARRINYQIHVLRTNHNSKYSNQVYKHVLHLFNIDTNSTPTRDWRLNHYLASHWDDLTNDQIISLGQGFDMKEFLNTAYNRHVFNKKYRNAYSNAQARFTATNKVKELGKQDTPFDTKVRAELIKDINRDREAYGLKPLTVTNAMQRVANYRNPKVLYAYEHYDDYMDYPHHTSNPADNWIHGDDTHTAGYQYLNAHHYNYHEWGANADSWYPENDVENDDGTPLRYDNNTPKGVADNEEDTYMNHDMSDGNNNGHRDAILNSHYKYLGVGVAYDPATQTGTDNEQFAC